NTLRSRNLVEPIIEHIRSGKPLLGICLGLQMLFETGYEDGEHKGLGVFGGACVRFKVDAEQGLKVPHMGWNQLQIDRPSPLTLGLESGSNVYFVHSYHVVPKDASIVASTTDYCRRFVCSY